MLLDRRLTDRFTPVAGRSREEQLLIETKRLQEAEAAEHDAEEAESAAMEAMLEREFDEMLEALERQPHGEAEVAFQCDCQPMKAGGASLTISPSLVKAKAGQSRFAEAPKKSLKITLRKKEGIIISKKAPPSRPVVICPKNFEEAREVLKNWVVEIAPDRKAEMEEAMRLAAEAAGAVTAPAAAAAPALTPPGMMG